MSINPDSNVSYDKIGSYGTVASIFKRKENLSVMGRSNHSVTYITSLEANAHQPKYIEAMSLQQRTVASTRSHAFAELLFSPVWVPVRALTSIFVSVLNIVTFGSITAMRDNFSSLTTREGLKQRGKAISQSALSILATPLAMGVEIACAASHIKKPTDERLDKLATRLWTGGRAKFN